MTDIYEKNESGQGFAAQIARQFHIPRWEQLPSIDLYMDQLLVYIANSLGAYFACTGTAGLTKSMVNNYVKSKIVDAPVNKKYPRLSVAMLVVVCILKNCYATEEIGKLIRLGISLQHSEFRSPGRIACHLRYKEVNRLPLHSLRHFFQCPHR